MFPPSKKYDVFISFRGEDTRATFTSQLHRALSHENIESYIDYNLVKGDEVGPALAQAIEDSHMSLVVFSANYASSKWCLDELLKVLECREHHGHVVIPVFYQIDPSHVRKHTGSYAEAFAKYERELSSNESHGNKVSEWKKALTDAANMSGWDSRTYRNDSEFIEDIVKDVWQKLSLMYPNELKGIIQIDEISKYIELLPKKLPRIGIWGMGGIGKTTIARQMFAKLFAQYDSVCFLEKVREESEKFGLPYIRNKLFGELLKRRITTSDVHGSHTFIKMRLIARKVFIVLDDVDNATQLEYLCGELHNFGPNSRIIITTRDRHTLSGRVDEIYEVTVWKFKESLQLFSLEAFKQSYPKEGYESLSKRAVAYAGGIPLALKVLGSHFYSRNTEFWKSELNYLENKGESLSKIQEVLKVSYNGLTWQEKEIFLDIAFFFIDENKDFVTKLLDSFLFNATSGIEILQDKALVTISNRNRIQMHDLLQKLALDIVREESRELGRRSRLRDAKEVHDVLKYNKGTDAIECIIFDLSQKVNLHFHADTFNMMTKLRFLKFYIPPGKKRSGTVYPPKFIMPFFDKLGYLEWNGYPFKSLPQPFRAEQLFQIRLPHSNVKYLWHGVQELVNLEAINLSECKQLIELPDLSGASKLKGLYLSGCESLCEVQPSVFSKDTLVVLRLERCKKLQSLISEKHLTSLQTVKVHGCSNLKEFSLSSDSIKSLDLSNTGIEVLHSSIGRLSNLWLLNLEGLRLANLPNEVSCLRKLSSLHISNCNTITKSKLEAIFDGLGLLKCLYLKDCCNLLELPANISSLSLLYILVLDGSNVETLPTSIRDLSELEFQSLDNCKKLGCLPELPPHVKDFRADNCTSLVTVSTLKTFSKIMNGKKKYISFKNGKMMELDGPSLDRITEDAIWTMKSAALHNIIVRKYRFQTHSFNYNSAVVCLPGRRVPRQFKYGTIYSSITIDISYSLGFVYSVIVSPSFGKKKHRNGTKIQCQCYSADGTEVGHKSVWNHEAITDLNMDHVFMWYDPYHSDSILSSCKRKVSFEFDVTTDTGEHDGFFCVKECGIYPIYYSEFPRLSGTLNLNKNLESELYDAIQFELNSIERYDEREGNDIESIAQIQNQELDLNEGSHSSYDSLIVSKGTQVYDNPQKKEKISKGNSSTTKTLKNFKPKSSQKEKEGLEEIYPPPLTKYSTEIYKSKILQKSSGKSREEIETSSQEQEQFEKENFAEDAESSIEKALKDSSKVAERGKTKAQDKTLVTESTEESTESDEPSIDDESYPSLSPIMLKKKDSSMNKADSLTKSKKDEEIGNTKKSQSYGKNKAPNVTEIASSSDTNLQQEEVPDKLNRNVLIVLFFLFLFFCFFLTTFIPPQTLPEVKQEKVKETVAAESSSESSPSKGPTGRTDEVSSKSKVIPEYSSLDYSEYKRMLEEKPLDIMEKLLSGELRRSSKAPQSITQAETTEVQSESIEMLLDNLRQLAFSRNLWKHLPNDMALGEEVKALLVKLNHRADELSEKQKLGVAEFTRIFRDATINIDEGQVNTDTLQQLEVDLKDSLSKLQASKDNIRRFKEYITANQKKVKDVDLQIEDIEAQIRQLKEQVHKLRQEKSLLEDTCSKCEEKITNMVKDVKTVSSETMQTLEKIAHFEKKKQESDSNYERLEGLYAKMRLSPPF